MAEADEDGNEEIEFEEFCLLLLKKRTEVQALGELREAFNVRTGGRRNVVEQPRTPGTYTLFCAHNLEQALDKNQDGWITREELELVDGLTTEEIDQIMAEADTNNDGKIGIDEFIAWR